MIKAWWLLLLIPAAGLGFMMAAMLSVGKSADSYAEGYKQGEKTGYFKGYGEGRENGLKTADILTEKPKVQVPMMIGGQCLKHELERKPWKPSGLFSPDFQPAFTPITSEQRTAIDRIMKNLIPSKPDSGLNTEDD